jgi:hypothetical protein
MNAQWMVTPFSMTASGASHVNRMERRAISDFACQRNFAFDL